MLVGNRVGVGLTRRPNPILPFLIPSQASCSGFHRSQLTNSWRCPPHGAPARLTEHQPRQPSVPAANSQFALVSDPSHVQPSHAAAAICTDSQSLLKAIQSGSANTADLRSMLNKQAEKTTLVWIPGHHGIADNEEVDACAKQAAAIADGAHRPVSFAAASALIRRTLTDPPP